MTGTPFDDLIDGRGGADQIDGGHGNDILRGGADGDILQDSFGVNVFEGGDGDDYINSYSLLPGQKLFGDAGNDQLTIADGTDSLLYGGAGNDTATFYGGTNSRFEDFEGNNRVVISGATGIVALFGAGRDSGEVINSQDIEIELGDGDDQLLFRFSSGASRIDAGRGNDVLTLHDTTVDVVAGEGDDRITASGLRQSSLSGGAGNDLFAFTAQFGDNTDVVISGGDGVDTYQFSLGSYTVTDFATGAGGDLLDLSYMLKFLPDYRGGNPFATEHLKLVQSGADTLLQIDADGSGPGAAVTFATLAGITVASLTAANLGGYDPGGAVLLGETINGTSAAEVLTGSLGDDVIYGEAGHDQIFGRDGDDVLWGGSHDDRLDGGLGDDRLTGGSGGDYLFDDSGQNIFDAGANNDQIVSTSRTAGQWIDGGDGSDVITLEYGPNSVVLAGAGQDYATLRYTQHTSFDGGTDWEQLTVVGSSFVTLVLGEGDDNDIVSITGSDNVEAWLGDGDDELTFQNGTGPNFVDAGEGDDRIVLASSTIVLEAGGGADTITARGLSQSLIDAGAGDDLIVFDNSLGANRDIVLTGGSGVDTFRLSVGPEDSYTITDLATGAGGDLLDLRHLLVSLVPYTGGNPFATGHLNLVQSGADTLLQVDRDGVGGDAAITLVTLQGVDVASLTAQSLGGYDPDGSPVIGQTITGTTGADTLVGTAGDDTLLGGDGNDVLSDEFGANLFEGGAGSDRLTSTSRAPGQRLNGGAGNDTFTLVNGDDSILIGGDGADYAELRNTSGSSFDGGNDRDTAIVENSRNVTLTLGEGDDTARIQSSSDMTIDLGNGFNSLVFNSGGGLNRITAGSGVDTMYIHGASVVLSAGAGNDILYASGLRDSTIDLGAGRDTITFTATSASGRSNVVLTGGAGVDTYQLDIGDFTITDFAAGNGGDVIDLRYLLNYAPLFPGGNPFGTGHVDLVQDGADTLLMFDVDGAAGSESAVAIARLLGVASNSLIGSNLRGLDPNGRLTYAPVLQSQSFTIAEDEDLSGQVFATDPDTDSAELTYFLTRPAGHGTVTVLEDGTWYYLNRDYYGEDSFTLRASDGRNFSNEMTITITLTPTPDAPEITSGYWQVDEFPVSVAENTRTVTTITAIDPDGDEVTFLIAGGADAARFAIDARSGVVSFRTAPDFENPADANGDNVYDVIVAASDGVLEDRQTLHVTVTDIVDEGLITGTSGADLLFGSDNDDRIRGLAGNDTLNGMGGDDILDGGPGNDTLYGAGGVDTVTYVSATAAVTASLTTGKATGGGGGDTLVNIENLTGSAFADSLTGNSGSNVLFGMAGDDELRGHGGNDTLNGGSGINTLAGGSGSDVFVFDVLEASALKDTITDFQAGADSIAFSRAAFAGLAGMSAGALDPGAFRAGSSATTADHRIIYAVSSGALYYDADGVGGAAQVQIASIYGKPVLDANDLFLI